MPARFQSARRRRKPAAGRGRNRRGRCVAARRKTAAEAVSVFRLGGLGGKVGAGESDGAERQPHLLQVGVGRGGSEGGTVGVSDHAGDALFRRFNGLRQLLRDDGFGGREFVRQLFAFGEQLQGQRAVFAGGFSPCQIGGLYAVGAFVNRRNPHVAQVLRHAAFDVARAAVNLNGEVGQDDAVVGRPSPDDGNQEIQFALRFFAQYVVGAGGGKIGQGGGAQIQGALGGERCLCINNIRRTSGWWIIATSSEPSVSSRPCTRSFA